LGGSVYSGFAEDSLLWIINLLAFYLQVWRLAAFSVRFCSSSRALGLFLVGMAAEAVCSVGAHPLSDEFYLFG